MYDIDPRRLKYRWITKEGKMLIVTWKGYMSKIKKLKIHEPEKLAA